MSADEFPPTGAMIHRGGREPPKIGLSLVCEDCSSMGMAVAAGDPLPESDEHGVFRGLVCSGCGQRWPNARGRHADFSEDWHEAAVEAAALARRSSMRTASWGLAAVAALTWLVAP